MPAKSSRQRKLFGIALAIKRGQAKCSDYPEACKIAKSMTEAQIREFAMKPKRRKKSK